MPAKGDILTSDKYNFPITQIVDFEKYQEMVQQPITATIEEIIKDLYKFAKEFPHKLIPHITNSQEIVDDIHNY